MCGRYAVTSAPEAIRALFGYPEQPNFPPRYNVAPTQPIAIVRLMDGKRQFALVRWGLLPSWVKDPKDFTLVINARGESVMECVEEGVGDRMCRHAHGDRVEAGEREIGDAAIRLPRKHESEGPRPERRRELLGGGRKHTHAPGNVGIPHVHDQRIERGAPLGSVEPRHGFAMTGIGTEPVNRFGRKCDKTPRR